MTFLMRWLLGIAVGISIASEVGTAVADCLCGTAADELTAERVGLEREWVIQLPFDAAGWRLTHVVVGDGIVIGQTGDGGVHAVATASAKAGEPRPGTLLWSHHIGTPGGPVQPAGVGRSLVTVARHIDIYALDRNTGSTRWHDRFLHAPAVGATPSGDWVYLPLDTVGVMRLPANPRPESGSATASTQQTKKKPDPKSKKKLAKSTAQKGRVDGKKQSSESLRPIAIEAGGHIDQSPLAFGDGILWCTTHGMLVAIEPTQTGWQRNEFFLNSPPAGIPVVRDSSIFAATSTGDLARLDALDQGGGGLRMTWRVFLDDLPDDGPLVSGDRVIVSLGESGIAAYSAENGASLWHSPMAGRVLAVSGDRVWCLDRVGRLSSLDAATGERRERLCRGAFSFSVVNRTTDRLILASPDGVLVSLAPAGTD